jgi:hypothetical protein
MNQNLTYTEANGYLIPDIVLPEQTEYEIGRFGQMRERYLKNHRKVLFTTLLTSNKLNEHLCETDQTANARLRLITTQMAKSEGVTEQLKAENQMLWVQRMNNIRSRAEEIINDELIYV